ncbi:unnamed protein product [Caretta caretta]
MFCVWFSRSAKAVGNGPAAAVPGVTVPFLYPRAAQAAVEQTIATVWIGVLLLLLKEQPLFPAERLLIPGAWFCASRFIHPQGH